MQPEYEPIMELTSFVWVAIPVLLHVLTIATQCLVAAYLLVHGIAAIAQPASASPLLRKLGALRPAGVDVRGFAFFQLSAGVLLLAPLALGLHWLASGFACALVVAALFFYGRQIAPEWQRAGRWVRGIAVASAVVTLSFMLWERDDPLTLGARILLKTQEWRTHELEWQLSNDLESPKVGDMAPDFELADPSGEKTIRLSSLIGKRPVALVFGSYT